MTTRTTQVSRGGARKGAGRKPITGTPLERHQVMLDAQTVLTMRDLADGNLSAGIRAAARSVRAGMPATTDAPAPRMNALFVPLQGRWFDAFASGAATTEYRLYGARWNERTCTPGRDVVLSRGYSGARLRACIVGFRTIPLYAAPRQTQDLFAHAARDALVAVIELTRAR